MCFFVVNKIKLCYNKIKNKKEIIKERTKKKMNKMYNNLNVDNLMKTEMFNQFNEKQQEEIRLGLEKNIEVSIYANSNFNFLQMRQIRLGLEKDLNVSIYAKSKFNSWQMEEIREGLKEGLDVLLYAKPKYNWKKMKRIRTKVLKERKNNEQNI